MIILVIFMAVVAQMKPGEEKRPGRIGNPGMVEGLLKRPIIGAGNLRIAVEIITEKCPDARVRPKIIGAVAKSMSQSPQNRSMEEIIEKEAELILRIEKVNVGALVDVLTYNDPVDPETREAVVEAVKARLLLPRQPKLRDIVLEELARH